MAQDKPLVSVVVPTYNRGDLIRPTLDSLLRQQCGFGTEIIVVDDGSTDGTFEKLVQRYPLATSSRKLRVIRQQNSGPARARNWGIEKARGKYVAFCDSDDISEPDRLAEQVKFLEGHPSYHLVHSKAIWIDENGRKLNSADFSNGIPLNYERRIWSLLRSGQKTTEQMLLEGGNPIHTSSVMAEKDLLLRLYKRDRYFFNPNLGTYAEDLDLWIRLAEISSRTQPLMGFLDKFCIGYRVGSSNLSNSINPKSYKQVKAFLSERGNARQRHGGKDPKLLVMTPVFDGGIGEVTIGQSEALFRRGFTGITFLKQPNWYGTAPEYSLKDLTTGAFTSPDKSDYYSKGFRGVASFDNALISAGVNSLDAAVIQGNQFAKEVKELKRRGIPVIYVCHSLIAHEDAMEGRVRNWARQPQETIMEAADIIQVMSQSYGEIVLRYYPHLKPKLRVIPNGCKSLEGEAARPVNMQHKLLAVGRLDNRVKSFDTLVDAIAIVAREYPDVKLKIAGNGPHESDLRNQILRLGLTRNVELLGWVDQEKIRELYGSTALFVHPSIHENYPMAVLDAIGHLVPVICSDIGGLIAYLKNNETALKVPSKNPSALAAAIKNGLRYPYNMTRMAERARVQFRGCTWDNVAEQLEQIVLELSGNKRGHRKEPERVSAGVPIPSATPKYSPAARGGKREGISLLVKAQNEVLFLEESIRSIAPYVDEIIFVDNNSTDGTYQRAIEVAKTIPGMKVSKYPFELGRERSQADLRNYMISKAAFSWCFEWDPDMIAYDRDPSHIKNLRALWEQEKGRVDMLSFGGPNVWGDFDHYFVQETFGPQIYLFRSEGFGFKMVPSKRWGGNLTVPDFPSDWKKKDLDQHYILHLHGIKPDLALLTRRLRCFYDAEVQNGSDETYMEYCRRVLKTSDLEGAARQYVDERVSGNISLVIPGVDDATFRVEHAGVQRFNYSRFGQHPAILQERLQDPNFVIEYSAGRPCRRVTRHLRF